MLHNLKISLGLAAALAPRCIAVQGAGHLLNLPHRGHLTQSGRRVRSDEGMKGAVVGGQGACWGGQRGTPKAYMAVRHGGGAPRRRARKKVVCKHSCAEMLPTLRLRLAEMFAFRHRP